HLSRQALLKVQFPGRIVGVRVAADFHVTADTRGLCPDQKDGVLAALVVRHGATEPPAAVAWTREVFRLHPSGGLVPVPPTCPTPQRLEDHIIDASKCPLARRVPV